MEETSSSSLNQERKKKPRITISEQPPKNVLLNEILRPAVLVAMDQDIGLGQTEFTDTDTFAIAYLYSTTCHGLLTGLRNIGTVSGKTSELEEGGKMIARMRLCFDNLIIDQQGRFKLRIQVLSNKNNKCTELGALDSAPFWVN